MSNPGEPRAIADRGQLRDDLITTIGCAANLELPDWPALVGCVEGAIAQLRAALALVEGTEGKAGDRAHWADLEYGVERRGNGVRG